MKLYEQIEPVNHLRVQIIQSIKWQSVCNLTSPLEGLVARRRIFTPTVCLSVIAVEPFMHMARTLFLSSFFLKKKVSRP